MDHTCITRLGVPQGMTGPRRPLSPGEIKAMADALGGLMRALQQAGPADRVAVYPALGLQLTYDPAANSVRAQVDLARGPGGVGGGT
jgi:hypothetical protein